MPDRLSLRQEADRLEDLARTDIPAARAALNAILDRPKRLDDAQENRSALSFNAKLITELRKRRVRIFASMNTHDIDDGA